MNVSRMPNRGRLSRSLLSLGRGLKGVPAAIGYVGALLGFVLLVVIVGAWLVRFAAFSLGLAL